VGSVAYRIIVAVAIKTNLFPTYFLKFVSVLIIAVALSVSPAKAAILEHRGKVRREKENAAAD
jgi:putative ABC transport system permease protein